MTQALGIDLGLRSGAVVLVTFSAPATPLHIVSIDRLLTTERRRNRSGANWTPVSIAQRGQQLFRGLESLDGLPVGMDWSPMEAYWGDKKNAVMKSFLAGYVYRRCLSEGAKPLAISPMQVRKTFGLKQGAPKEDVHRVLHRYMSDVPPDLSEHEADAILLAIIAYTQLKGDTSWQTQLRPA